MQEIAKALAFILLGTFAIGVAIGLACICMQ